MNSQQDRRRWQIPYSGCKCYFSFLLSLSCQLLILAIPSFTSRSATLPSRIWYYQFTSSAHRACSDDPSTCSRQSVVTKREAIAYEIAKIVGDVADKWGAAIEGTLIKDIIFSLGIYPNFLLDQFSFENFQIRYNHPTPPPATAVPTEGAPPPPPPTHVQNYGPEGAHENFQFQYSQCNGKKKALCVCFIHVFELRLQTSTNFPLSSESVILLRMPS